MSLSDLASLGSFVSGVAVLASLVFLFLQMRQMNAQVLQTERNQRAILQQGRAARSVGSTLQAASSPSLADVIQRASTGDPQVTRTAFFQFWFWATALFMGFEDTYLQHSQGMLDDAAFESTVGLMRRNLSLEGFRAAWRVMRLARPAGFREYVDGLLDEAAAAPPGDVFDLWKAALERAADPASTGQ